MALEASSWAGAAAGFRETVGGHLGRRGSGVSRDSGEGGATGQSALVEPAAGIC